MRIAGYRYRHRPYNGIEDSPDKRLISQQRRPCRFTTDFFRRAAHVDVDDVCTQLYVQPSGFSHLTRIRARQLDPAKPGFIGMG